MRAGLFNEEIKLFKKVNKVSDFGSTKVECEEWKKVRAKVEHKSETRIIESESKLKWLETIKAKVESILEI